MILFDKANWEEGRASMHDQQRKSLALHRRRMASIAPLLGGRFGNALGRVGGRGESTSGDQISRRGHVDLPSRRFAQELPRFSLDAFQRETDLGGITQAEEFRRCGLAQSVVGGFNVSGRTRREGKEVPRAHVVGIAVDGGA
ncbi:MAG: hypothetical protein K1X57_22390, partial [Gemmataceae bacterium]|nr:hypothetical protein [Gemmataceae bacterium]